MDGVQESCVEIRVCLPSNLFLEVFCETTHSTPSEDF